MLSSLYMIELYFIYVSSVENNYLVKRVEY